MSRRLIAWTVMIAMAQQVGAEAFASGDPDELDLDLIDNGDGAWSYELPDDFDPHALRVGPVLTKRYDGQAKFAFPGEPHGTMKYVVRPSEHRTLAERLQRRVRIDSAGRRWKVVAVDEDAAGQVISQVNDRVGATPADFAGGVDGLDENWPVGTEVEWRPYGWTSHDCNSDGTVDQRIWSGDGRTAKHPAFLTERQKTAVTIRSQSGTVLCSGVSVEQDVVMTAAHCVHASNGFPLHWSSFQVCRYESGQGCLNVVDYDVPDDYDSFATLDPNDDWALIKLQSTWEDAGADPTPTMALSWHSDAILRSLPRVHNLGFPQWVGTSCSSTGNTLYHNVEQEPIAGVLSKKVRLKIDGTKRQSGSPLYFCPWDDPAVCGPGEYGAVFAVFAGDEWTLGGWRFVGPKVSSFRDDAIVMINSW